MTGREEHRIASQKNMMIKIQKMPEIIQKYYYYLNNKYEYKTTEKYIYYVKKYIDSFEKIDYIYNINSSSIDKYIMSLDFTQEGNVEYKSDAYKCFVWRIIKNFYQFLISQKLVEHNPCITEGKPKMKKRKNTIVLTDKEINEVIKCVTTGVGTGKSLTHQANWRERDILLILLLIQTGARCTELNEINIEDIDFDECSIKSIGKGGKEYTKVFDTSIIPYFEKWISKREVILGNRTGALFISNRKVRMSVTNIEKLVHKYTSTLDKKISPHKFRSTYGTNLYKETGDIEYVRRCMGHSDIGTTGFYIIDNDQCDRAKAAKIMSKKCKLYGKI